MVDEIRQKAYDYANEKLNNRVGLSDKFLNSISKYEDHPGSILVGSLEEAKELSVKYSKEK